MPIYEYKCPACGHRFAVLQRIGEGNEHLECEKCGTPKPIKQFSTFSSSGMSGEDGGFGTSGASGGSPFT